MPFCNEMDREYTRHESVQTSTRWFITIKFELFLKEGKQIEHASVCTQRHENKISK